MSYESEFTPFFLRLLRRLDRQIGERVLTAIADVLNDPHKGSQLTFMKEVLFKWRIGDYRMIYKIDEKGKTITFILVDHRSRAYRKF